MTQARSPQNSLPRTVLRGTVGAVFLGLLASILLAARTRSGPGLLESISHADPVYLLAAGLCFVIAHIADGARLFYISRAAHKELSFGRAFRTIIASDFAALVTPFLSGGPTCNLWMLNRSGIGAATSGALIVAGTAISRFVISALALFLPLMVGAGAVLPDLFWSQLFAVIPVNVVTGIAILLASYQFEYVNRLISALEVRWSHRLHLTAVLGALRRNVKSFHDSIRLILQGGYRYALISAAFSFIHFGLQFSVSYLVLRSLNVRVLYPMAVAAEMVILILASAAPTPGGSGAVELLIAALLGAAIPAQLLAAFVVLWRLSTYYLMITMGSIAFFLEFRSSQKPGRT